jgi:hypothetical protein
MSDNPFTKAVKTQAKLRLAIDGPTGSGKTYTSLICATALANGGKIAVIDTERGSAALYSDKFSFDTATLNNYSPKNYIDLIDAAGEKGYAVIVVDSLSHAWEGEGGALDMVDAATKRSQSGNSYTAWKDVTPIHRRMIDAMLQSTAHVIVTMRSKMEYAMDKDDKGRTVIRKLGLAPIQRQGMEYEFTIVCDMDTDHNLVVTKSRMETLADQVVNKPDTKFFKKILDWLNSGAPESTEKKPAQAAQKHAVPPTADRPWNNDFVTLKTAMSEKASDGTLYWDMDTEPLTHRLNALIKPNPDLTKDQLAVRSSKRQTIQAILAYRQPDK